MINDEKVLEKNLEEIDCLWVTYPAYPSIAPKQEIHRPVNGT